MTRGPQRYQLRLIKELPLSPLMGVVLVLALIFLFTLPFWQPAPMSEPAAPSAMEPASTVTLQVEADLALRLDGKIVTREVLVQDLRQLAHQRPSLGVIVAVQRDLPVHVLVDLMGDLQAAGIAKTAVTTPLATQ